MLEIVLVNWNAGSQLKAALASIAEYHSGLVDSIIIVDNASADESLAEAEVEVAAQAEAKLPYAIRIIRNKFNLGFGAACNQGAALATSKYILFLNPDTRLFERSLCVPSVFMEDPANSDVGIVGIQLVDERGYIARSCSRFPSLTFFLAQAFGINRLHGLRQYAQTMDDWAHDRNQSVDQVMGAFFMMRRQLFEMLGGFDQRFFVYFEEVDLSYRARQAGNRSVFLADAQAFHAGGGTSRQVKAHRLFYSLRSRLLFGFKHFPLWQAWALVAVTLAIEPGTRSMFSLVRGGVLDAGNTLRAYGMLIRDLPAVLARARRP